MRIPQGSSPLRKTVTAPFKTLMISAMLISLAAPAYADDEAALNDTLNEDGKQLKRQILKSLDEPNLGTESSGELSEEPWFSGFRVSKKGPIQFRQTLQIGGDEVSLKISGPVIKRKPGLKFQLEGLRIGDHPVRVEGYGNVREGGLRFTVRY